MRILPIVSANLPLKRASHRRRLFVLAVPTQKRKTNSAEHWKGSTTSANGDLALDWARTLRQNRKTHCESCDPTFPDFATRSCDKPLHEKSALCNSLKPARNLELLLECWQRCTCSSSTPGLLHSLKKCYFFNSWQECVSVFKFFRRYELNLPKASLNCLSFRAIPECLATVFCYFFHLNHFRQKPRVNTYAVLCKLQMVQLCWWTYRFQSQSTRAMILSFPAARPIEVQLWTLSPMHPKTARKSILV